MRAVSWPWKGVRGRSTLLKCSSCLLNFRASRNFFGGCGSGRLVGVLIVGHFINVVDVASQRYTRPRSCFSDAAKSTPAFRHRHA